MNKVCKKFINTSFQVTDTHKLQAYTHKTDNFAINFSWVYMTGH